MTNHPDVITSPDGTLKIYKNTGNGSFLDHMFPKPEVSVKDAVAIFEFEGAPVRAFTINGRRMIGVREQGQALSYAREGATFVESVREWMEQGELRPDEHVVRVEGEALKRVKELNPDLVSSRATALIAFTEQGAIRAAMLAGGPKSIRFRDWITKVVFNVMTTGRHVEPGAPAEPTPKALLSLAELTAASREARLSKRPDLSAIFMTRAAELVGGPLPTPPAVVPPSPQLRLPMAKVDPWTALINAWEAEGGEPAKTTALLRIADKNRLFTEQLKGHHGHGRACAFGRLLWRQRSRVIGGRLLTVSKLDGCTVWRLAEMAA